MPQTSKRPERRYRSLAEFRVKNWQWSVRESRLLDPTFWPCVLCSGRGWYHNPDDRDPIEGYKLAPAHKCQACAGTGRGTKEAVKAIYDEIVAKFRADLTAWKEAEGHRKSGLSKLTQEEKNSLGL